MRALKWLPFFLLLIACVDRIEFQTGDVAEQLVVEGMISDEPGPYTVLLSKAFPTSRPERIRKMVSDAQVDLYEDNVKIGSFIESDIDSGVYRTPSAIQGRTGKTYHIVITTKEGKQYSSQPELIRSRGTVDVLFYEHESVPVVRDDSTSRERFNVYVNATPSPDESYTRWRLTGTYLVETFPEQAIVQFLDGTIVPTPLPCSGVIYDGENFRRVRPCTCCFCWITVEETIPHLGNEALRNGSGYNNVKVGEVNITRRTFYDSYRIEVEQFALSPEAYEFFRLVEAQALGAGSLFQPSFGAIRGNIIPKDQNDHAVGLFWAASVARRSRTIRRSEVPVKLAPIDTLGDACDVIGRKATRIKPSFWP